MAAQETHTCNQADQAEIMVTVQVGNENMIDPAPSDLVFVHLCLSAFATVYKEKMVVKGHHLGCRVPVEGWNSRIISKYGYREHR